MSQVDDFVRAQSSVNTPGSMRASMSGASASMNRSSFKLLEQKDPYSLDFTALRRDYVDETTIQIPFVKSSFVHYSKCPRNMKINGRKYKDLVLTMEIIQAPTQLEYHQLDDPQEARRKAAEKKRRDMIDAKKAEVMKEKRAVFEEKRAIKEKAKQERLQKKQA